MSRTNLAYKTQKITAAEYLKFERSAKDKHEFIGGRIVMRASANDLHHVISSNVLNELLTRLKGKKCRAFASDMRVNARRGNYFYPDIVITCGERKFEDGKKDVLINPTVIIEVLSKSTKLKDRNEKFDSYIQLESLTDYVLIEQNSMRVEHFSKTANGSWQVQIYTEAKDAMIFESLECRLTLAEIYAEDTF